jgi:hypothetical protein
MASPKHSDRLQKVWDELHEGFRTEDADGETDEGVDETLEECADSSCTNGFDNDGSSGFEIFENGYQLAEKAAGRPVFYVDGDGVSFFFVGTEDETEAKLRKAKEDEHADA